MMPRATLFLVLLVSCAHGLVHMYELALPSVEQQIADEFYGAEPAAGKVLTGRLSNAWRLMWGLGAVLAGLLVDRFGARKLLAIYLIGCGAACAVAAAAPDRSTLFLAMLLMGALASIYHPAGLALISHETQRANRPRALGIHGIFGSAGIGTAPLLAGALLAGGGGWRQIYWVLMAPGLVLGMVFVWQALRRPPAGPAADVSSDERRDQEHADWRSFFTLTVMASLQGFVYSALMSFLPRYLSGVSLAGLPADQQGNFIAAGVLLVGCAGQELAGRFARPAVLERQLTLVTFSNVPFLLWMAFATGEQRAAAAALWALVHFMHQPIYNSLVAKYTPQRRRSLCYGFSFAMAFGLGSFGASFAGHNPSDQIVYATMGATAAAAGLLCAVLWSLNRDAADGYRVR